MWFAGLCCREVFVIWRGNFASVAGVVILSLTSQANPQTTYSVTDLGLVTDLTNRSDSGPKGINKVGSVAGANVVGNSYHAMLYESGVWKDLGTLGGNESLAGGIDDAGRVVGYSHTDAGSTNAFLWTPGGTNGVPTNPQMRSLGTLGGLVSQAYAINEALQVTGYSDVPAHPTSEQNAFLYSAGTMADIGSGLNSLPNSFGYGINASGHVAGAAYDPAFTAPRVFFFDGLNAADLGAFGQAGATALAINNSDTLAGYLTTTSSFDHAFVYSGGNATDLGTLGGHYSYALGINNSNVLVGGSFTDSQDSIYHAFVASGGVMVDLNNQLDQTGTGWTLIEARAVNDADQVAGVGVLGGVSHAFLLTPAAPTAQPQPTRISNIGLAGSNIFLQFATVAGRQYTVQTNATLSASTWADAAPPLTGNGATLSVTNALKSSKELFYRVRTF